MEEREKRERREREERESRKREKRERVRLKETAAAFGDGGEEAWTF
jgi:hypothetical protein